MAKKCDCSAVLAVFDTDPRLQALPLAARALWLVLVRHMQQLGVSVLRFGSDVPNRMELAMLVRVPETELEANLAVLLARGLLDEGEDGALGSPLLRAALVRSETNRINGLKGGRPRKVTPGTDPRQGYMAHAIPGGAAVAAVAAETKPEAGAAPPGSPAKLAVPSALQKEAKAAVTDEAYHAAGQAVLMAMGEDLARSRMHYGIVRQWLADGADQALMLGVIEARMARGAKPQSPGYFTKAIAEAIQKRDAAAPAPTATPEFARWNAAYQEWAMTGRVGPMPTPPAAVNRMAA